MRSVQELEALVNEQLRVELEQVQDERDRLYERISHCMELKNNMTMLQDQKRSSLKTMVDLGCSFYVQARMCAQPLRAAPRPRVPGPPSLSGPCQVCAQTRHLVGVRRRGPRLPRPDDPGGGDRLQHAAREQADRGGGGARPMWRTAAQSLQPDPAHALPAPDQALGGLRPMGRDVLAGRHTLGHASVLVFSTQALTQRAAKLKAQIKLTIGAIDEILAGRGVQGR